MSLDVEEQVELTMKGTDMRYLALRTLSALTCVLVSGIRGSAREAAHVPGGDSGAPSIDRVFFAQQHVQEPDDRLFKLVGNLAALLKVQVYSEVPRRSPDVVAILKRDGKTHEFTLRGPAQLPRPYVGEPEMMPHAYEDSFTGIIPREWIRPGLEVTVELREYSFRDRFNPPGNSGVTVFDRRVIDNLRVGAGSKVLLTSFDIHFFEKEEDADFPAGWEIALADRLPVAEFEVQRVRRIVFPELVMPPMGGHPAIRCRSMEDFERRTGLDFDGESAAARVWMRALKRAGGRHYGHGVVFLNLAAVPANGWGESSTLAGTTDLGRMGNLIHEVGHVFSLPHWLGVRSYPYVGEMYGIRIPAMNPAREPHVGPRWAYSLHRRAFISPIVQEGAVGGVVGTWKRDPMQGGGYGDQEEQYMVRHFSDYSVYRMQNFIERRLLFWDEERKAYLQWNEDTASYSIQLESDGWNLAPDPRAEVVSLLVSASAVTPEANFVYPPIGPYQAGLLHRFDADSAEDRARARLFGFSEQTCDVCVRVTQGGETATYLLDVKLDPRADPLTMASYVTTAINLPAGDGAVSAVDLLHTPGVMSRGVPDDATVLYRWRAPEPPAAVAGDAAR